MKLTAYLYKGPPSSASLRHEGETLDVQLIPEKSVDLPAEHEYTLVLLHLKQLELQPVKGVKKTTTTETTEGGAAQ